MIHFRLQFRLATMEIVEGTACGKTDSCGITAAMIEQVTCLDCLIGLNTKSDARFNELWANINEAQGELFKKRLPRKPVKEDPPVEKDHVPGNCRICGGKGMLTIPVMADPQEGFKSAVCWNCGSTGKDP